MNMKILAIDPGPETSAWLLWDGQKVIGHDGECSNACLIQGVLSSNLIPFDILVIEQVACMGMAVGAEVFETVFWSGRFAQMAAEKGKQWDRVKRHQVKMHLCNSMKAKDANIRCALIDKLGKPGTKKAQGPTYGVAGHLWAALAVAITWQETKRCLPSGQLL